MGSLERGNMKKILLLIDRLSLINLCILWLFAPCFRKGVKCCFSIAVIFWLVQAVIRGKWYFWRYLFPQSFLNRPLLLFLSVSLLSVIFSLNFYHSQKIFFGHYLPYLLLFWMTIISVRSNQNVVEGDGRKLVSGSLIGALVFSAFIFAAGCLWDNFIIQHPLSPGSVFGVEVWFGMAPFYITVYILLCYSFIIDGKA